jgi:hypothetical protein
MQYFVPGFPQLLTKISTRNLPGGKARPARKADSISDIYEPIFYKKKDLRYLTTVSASKACFKDSFSFLHVL